MLNQTDPEIFACAEQVVYLFGITLIYYTISYIVLGCLKMVFTWPFLYRAILHLRSYCSSEEAIYMVVR